MFQVKTFKSDINNFSIRSLVNKDKIYFGAKEIAQIFDIDYHKSNFLQVKYIKFFLVEDEHGKVYEDYFFDVLYLKEVLTGRTHAFFPQILEFLRSCFDEMLEKIEYSMSIRYFREFSDESDEKIKFSEFLKHNNIKLSDIEKEKIFFMAKEIYYFHHEQFKEYNEQADAVLQMPKRLFKACLSTYLTLQNYKKDVFNL
jgi:hypothetical protein